MSNLLGPDGRPLPESQCVKYNGKKYPYRVIDQEVFAAAQIDPKIGLMATLVQTGDQNNLLWLGMLALAKDLYSRSNTVNGETQHTYEFLDFAKQLNMNIIDLERKSTDVAAELRKTIGL